MLYFIGIEYSRAAPEYPKAISGLNLIKSATKLTRFLFYFISDYNSMADNNAGMQNQEAPQKVRVSVKEVMAKARSKREIFNLLSVDAGVYLPAYGKCKSRLRPFGLILFILSFLSQIKLRSTF